MDKNAKPRNKKFLELTKRLQNVTSSMLEYEILDGKTDLELETLHNLFVTVDDLKKRLFKNSKISKGNDSLTLSTNNLSNEILLKNSV
jgi:hypothetical protein